MYPSVHVDNIVASYVVIKDIYRSLGKIAIE